MVGLGGCMEDIFLTVTAVARRVGISESAIRAAADAARLKVSARTSDGSRLFKAEDIERFISDRAERAAKLAKPAKVA